MLSRFLLGPLLFLVRLPLLLVAFVAYFVAVQLLALVHLRLAARAVHAVGARLLLLLLGYWWVDTRHARLSRRCKAPTSTPGSHYTSGDLVVANLQGFAEVLYLAFRFAPVFTAVPIDSSVCYNPCHALSLSLARLLSASLSHPVYFPAASHLSHAHSLSVSPPPGSSHRALAVYLANSSVTDIGRERSSRGASLERCRMCATWRGRTPRTTSGARQPPNC